MPAISSKSDDLRRAPVALGWMSRCTGCGRGRATAWIETTWRHSNDRSRRNPTALGRYAGASATTRQRVSARSSLPVGTTNPVGPRDTDDSDATPHCWLGCKRSLQRTSPTEWSASTQSRIDSLESHLKRDRHPLAPAAIRANEAAPVSAATTMNYVAHVEAEAASATSRTSNAETQRYLIEEWQRSELNIADSLHHAVLKRIIEGSSGETDELCAESNTREIRLRHPAGGNSKINLEVLLRLLRPFR